MAPSSDVENGDDGAPEHGNRMEERAKMGEKAIQKGNGSSIFADLKPKVKERRKMKEQRKMLAGYLNGNRFSAGSFLSVTFPSLPLFVPKPELAG